MCSDISAQVQARVDSEAKTAENEPVIDSKFVRKCLRNNELGDGWLYSAIHKDNFVFSKSLNGWLVWSGHHWEYDRLNMASAGVEDVADVYEIEAKKIEAEIEEARSAENTETEKKLVRIRKNLWGRAGALRKRQGRANCLEFAHTSKTPLAIHGQELDENQWLLPCKNGVIDLKTGELLAGRQSDYMLRACPAEWHGIDAEAPEWDRALGEIFNDRADLVDYVRRVFGFGITGTHAEHVFPVFHGQGRNGKSMIVETVSAVLGDLARPIQADMLLDQGRARGSAGPTPDIMSLKGLRIAFASETDAGRKISPSRVKWLTGGDELVGRNPHDKFEVSFQPTHTLFLLTNNKPHAPADDYAFWERCHLIPFDVSFVNRAPSGDNERPVDLLLPEKLAVQQSGILAWLVRGCLEWQAEGLNPPPVVKNATAEYRREEDMLADFIDDCCYVDPDAVSQATAMHNAFVSWFEVNVSSKNAPKQKTFGRLMGKKFEKRKQNGSYWYFGVGLRTDLVEINAY